MRQKFVKNLARQRRAVRFIQHNFRTFVAAVVSFSVIAFSLVFMPISSTAAVPVLNDNTDVFQLSFTGATASNFTNLTLVTPNNLQAQWSLNPTYNSTTKNYDVGTNWITIPSTTTPYTTIRIPFSGSGPNGTVTALAPVVADVVVLTIRADPLAASSSLGGYLGTQAATAGTKTATTVGDHNTTGNAYVKELLSFGAFTGFTYLTDAFSRAPNSFTISAKLPSTVTDLSYLLTSNSINGNGYNKADITAWDVSNVTNFSHMFENNWTFNQDISGWNTGKATNMAYMFASAIKFNQPIGSWNTALVTDMSAMFYNANLFNQPLDSWNTSSVTNMYYMFSVAIAFNQNLNSWDVSRVTNMLMMFMNNTAFNGDIRSWNTSSVTDMGQMFNGANKFNQDIGGWNVSNVTSMSLMFKDASLFNQNLNSWNVSKVTTMASMFYNARAFNNGLASGVNGDMTWTMASTVTTMASMFYGATAFNQNLTTWNTSAVTAMANMFYGATRFNGTVNGWNTANVTSMTQMFYSASAFNKPVSNWNVSKVLNFSAMFRAASAFNQSLNTWVPSSASFFDNFFNQATSFNNGDSAGSAGSMTWSNLKSVTTMASMFYGATAFNQNLNSWQMVPSTYNLTNGTLVSSMTYNSMFFGATSFNNGNAGSMTWNLTAAGVPWTTSAAPATDMTSMFQGATSFNQNINSWDVSYVSLMPNMFYGASSFNNGLAAGVSGNMTWKMASGLTDINGMFYNATSFNQSVSTWVTTQVSKFYNLLTGATSFNQSLSSFDVVSWSNATGMTFPASMSDANVQDTLKSWAWQAHAGTIVVNLAATHTPYSDCASYNAFLRFTGTGAITTGLRPTPPTCNNTGTLAWSPSTTNTSPTVVNGINQASSNMYTFTPSAAPTGGNDYLYASQSAMCQVDPNTGVITYRGNATPCVVRVVDPTITGAGVTAGSYVDVSFTMTSYTAPAMPTSPTASGVDATTARVAWTAPTSTGGTSLVSYTAYYAAASAPTVYVPGCTVAATATTCDITGLATGTSYTFKVVAWNGAMFSSLTSAAATASLPLDVAPGAPTITAIDPGGAGNQIVISYTTGTNTGSAITGYEYSTDNGITWKTVPTVTSTTLTIAQESGSLTAPVFGTNYTIKIRAKNTMTGAASNSMTGYAEIKKDAPTGITITGSTTQLSVSFTAPTTPSGGNGITTYEYSTDGGVTWKQRATGTTASPLVITTLSSSTAALTAGTTYPVQIRAKNLLVGTASASVYGTTDVTPGAPTGLVITPGYLQLSVAFTAPAVVGTGITKYQYSTDTGTTWADFSGLTSPQVITTQSSNGLPLANKTSYTIKIRAFNTIPGTASSALVGTTIDPAPGAPSALVATPSDGQISVAFTAGSNTGSPITKYQYTTDNGMNWYDAVGTSSPVTITGLTNGTSYSVKLRAYNTSAGTAATAAASAVTPNVALAAPTNVTATLNTFSATISWTAPVGNVSTYVVNSDHGLFTCSTATTSCVINGLTSGSTFSFTVTATNNIGTSPSSVFSNTVTTPSTPGAPTSVSAVGSGSTADVSWTAGSGAPADYYVVTASPSGRTCVVFAPATTCTVTGLTPGTAYTFSVVATNGVGSSPTSASSSSVTPDTAPGAPTLNSIAVDSQQISLAFTAGTNSGSAIVKYQYSTDGGVNWADLTGTSSPQVITQDSSLVNLVDNTNYSVVIRAVNTLSGSASNSLSAKPNVNLSAPTGATVSLSGTTATISWTAPSGHIDSYLVSSNTGGLTCSATAPTTTCDIANLVLGTTYFFTVTATNSAGTSAASGATASITPDNIPGAPTIDSISVGDRQLSIAFTPGTNTGSALTKYQYTTDGGLIWKDLAGLTSPQIITTTSGNVALTNNTSYAVKIRAFNTRAGGASNELSQTPNISLSAPTAVSATVSANSATVSWTAPSGSVSSYLVTSNPGGLTCTVSGATSCIVNGLPYGINYTFTVTATNSAGTSPASLASNSVLPEVNPGAPTITGITPADKQLSIAFTAGTNTGSAIVKYQYTTDGGVSWKNLTGLTSPFVITTSSTNVTLVNGQSYSVGLRAVNTTNGAASAYTATAPNIPPPRPITYWITATSTSLSFQWAPGAPNLGSPVTKYQYTTDNGATWKDISGLPNGGTTTTITSESNNAAFLVGNSYTVNVRAINTIPSVMSQGVTSPCDVVLSAPTITEISPGDAQLSIAFTPPAATGGTSINRYYYSTDGGTSWIGGNGLTSPLVISTTSTGVNLVNGTTYNVQIKAKNMLLGVPTATTQGTPDVIPGAPTITSTSVSDKQISVNFTAGTNTGSALTKYQYSTDGGNTWADASDLSSPFVLTRDSSNATLVNGQTYSVALRAKNTLFSAATSPVSALPEVAPGAPHITVVTPGDKQLSVAFTAGTNAGSAITKYQYSTDLGATWRDYNGTSSPLVLTKDSSGADLVNGQYYALGIRAFNTAAGPDSGFTAAYPDVAPGAPSGVTITPGDRQLSVAFTPGTNIGSAIVKYQYTTDGLTWRDFSGTSSPQVITTVSAGSNTQLVNGTAYSVRIRAYNTLAGVFSINTTASPDIAPNAPVITSIETAAQQLNVKYAAATTSGSAITTYQYSTDGGTTWRTRAAGTTASPLVITTTSDANTALVDGVSYSVKLRALNTMNGAASNSSQATPNPVPGAVTNLGAAPGDASAVLNWNAPVVGSFDDYLIEYSTDGSTFASFAHSPTTGTTITVSGLSNGTAYKFRVTAINGMSIGPASNITEWVTPRANQAPLLWAMSDTTMSYMGTVTLATSGGSGTGQVVYSVTPAQSCAISGNVLTAGDAGTSCAVTATKVADSTYNAVSTSTRTITVTPISQHSAPTFANAASMTYGQSLTLIASGGSGTGSLIYSVVSAGTTGCVVNASTGVLTVTAIGTCRVGVQRGSSTNYVSSSVTTQDIVVTGAPQSISWTSTIPVQPIAGDTYTLATSLTSGLNATYSTASSNCSIAGSVVTFTASGSCVVTASRAATSQYLAALDVTQTISVGHRNQVLNFVSATRSIVTKTYGDAAFTVSALSSEPTAVLTYSRGSNTTNTACSVSPEGVVSILAVGLCEIQADSVGTAAFVAASPITQVITIQPGLASAPFITSTSGGNLSLTLSFIAPSYVGGSAVTDYQITAIPQSGNGPTVTHSGCGTTAVNGVITCTVQGLTAGIEYRAQIAAINAAGLGMASALSDALLVVSNPSAVQALTVTQLNALLELNWLDPDSLGGGTFVEHQIFVKRSADANYTSAHFAVNDYTLHAFQLSTVSPSGAALQNGVAYDVKIVTVTSANTSELTANTAVVNQIPRTVPDAPRSPTALVAGDKLVVAWQAPVSDGGAPISAYNVQFAGSPCVPVAVNDTTCTVPLPQSSGNYAYAVLAVNAAGHSAPAAGTFSVMLPSIDGPVAPVIGPGGWLISSGTSSAAESAANVAPGTTFGMGSNKVKVWNTPAVKNPAKSADFAPVGIIIGGVAFFFLLFFIIRRRATKQTQ